MGFEKGNQFGSYITRKGVQNKVSDRIKPILEGLSLELLNSIEVDKLSIRERLELLKITIGYTLPKLKQVEPNTETSGRPLIINLGDGINPANELIN